MTKYIKVEPSNELEERMVFHLQMARDMGCSADAWNELLVFADCIVGGHKRFGVKAGEVIILERR